MYNVGSHCKLVCITKCVIHPVEIKDIIIIIITIGGLVVYNRWIGCVQ